MAEGFCREYFSKEFNVFSAGTRKHGMNDRAIKVMKEIGIDISHHHSKKIDELPGIHFDFVFTVCDAAKETCPYIPGSKTIHVSFQDPPALTKSMTDEDQILSIYRKVRDEINKTVTNLKTYL
jgi:arsenate reductase